MTNQTKSRGFTIVELLIVIVVIAILAAITIVAYNGITKNANASAAASNAQGVKDFANIFAGDDTNASGRYPDASEITTGTSTYGNLPKGINVVTTIPTSSSTKTDISYIAKGTSGNATGACIGYYSPKGSGSVQWRYVGNAAGTAPTTGSPTCA